MQVILDFFSGMFEPIQKLFDFAISFWKDLVYLVQLTGTFLANIPTYFAWMPSQFVTTLYILFCIVVVYKVLGREG